MASARNMRKCMFTKLDLKRILSRHHCTIRPDPPVFFSEPRKSTMADFEKEANMLDYEPASDHEESGEDNSGRQGRELTDAAVDDLLNLEDELDSTGDFEPRNQPPLKAKGTTKASLHPEPEEAAQVTALSAIQAELEKVKADVARKEKHQA